jgi:hypothetical protein
MGLNALAFHTLALIGEHKTACESTATLGTLSFVIADSDVEVVAALKAAADRYLGTSEGQSYLDASGGTFNWYDAVAAVPQDILILQGIYYVGPLPVSEEHECLVIDAAEDLIGFPVDLAQPDSD